jgi:hypothetical protein
VRLRLPLTQVTARLCENSLPDFRCLRPSGLNSKWQMTIDIYAAKGVLEAAFSRWFSASRSAIWIRSTHCYLMPLHKLNHRVNCLAALAAHACAQYCLVQGGESLQARPAEIAAKSFSTGGVIGLSASERVLPIAELRQDGTGSDKSLLPRLQAHQKLSPSVGYSALTLPAGSQPVGEKGGNQSAEHSGANGNKNVQYVRPHWLLFVPFLVAGIMGAATSLATTIFLNRNQRGTFFPSLPQFRSKNRLEYRKAV